MQPLVILYPVPILSKISVCPVLFHLVKHLSWNDGSLPGAFNALLTALWERSIGPFELLMPNNANAPSTASNSSANAAANATNTTANATDATSNASHTTTNANNAAANSTHNTTNNEPDTFLESLSFFPKLPTVRTRGTYPQDFKNEKQACRKPGKPQKTLLPGTVTMRCQHDMCICQLHNKYWVLLLFIFFFIFLFFYLFINYIKLCAAP